MSRCVLGIDVGIRNLSFCELAVDPSKTFAVKQWEVVDLLDGDVQSANKVHLETLHHRLEEFLAETFPPNKVADFSAVGIELQPQGRLSNLRMLIVSHLIYAYFRGMRNQGALQTVRFVAAKLKYPKKHMTACGLRSSRIYKERKRNSVNLCKHLTTGLPVRGKVDDLADSFLIAHACI
jgi:hypothetical protein